jgi:hypothetical protein
MLLQPSRILSLRTRLYCSASPAFSPQRAGSKNRRRPISSGGRGVFVTEYWTMVSAPK